jgi:uncharacterized protein YjeT (DUF2065 family)
MAQSFLMALGLVLIIEGMLPFLAPRFWRRMMQHMLIQSDKALHIFGLASMLAGLVMLYFFS